MSATPSAENGLLTEADEAAIFEALVRHSALVERGDPASMVEAHNRSHVYVAVEEIVRKHMRAAYVEAVQAFRQGIRRSSAALRHTAHCRGRPMNAECSGCGVTAADLPYEELGLTLDEASEFLFEDGRCQGCPIPPGSTQDGAA